MFDPFILLNVILFLYVTDFILLFYLMLYILRFYSISVKAEYYYNCVCQYLISDSMLNICF